MVADLKPSSSSPPRQSLAVPHNRLAMPPFEFFRLASALRSPSVFLRDLDESWYHPRSSRDEHGRGVDGRGARTHRARRRGPSEGVYGGIPRRVRLAPLRVRSRRPRSPRTRSRPRRSWPRSAPVRPRPPLALADARDPADGCASPTTSAYIIAGTDGRSALHLHYGATHSLDRLHAQRLQGLPESRSIPSRAGDTDVIKELRDRGELGPMIAEALPYGLRAEIRWRRADPNRRPPGCKPGALPTELRPHVPHRSRDVAT